MAFFARLLHGREMGFEDDISVIEEVVLRRDPAFEPLPMVQRRAALDALHHIDGREAFILGAMRVVAMAGNGHSRVIPNAAIRVAPHRIVMRGGSAAMVVGHTARRIETVNGVDPSALQVRWADWLAGNPVRRQKLSGIMLGWPAALAAAGLETGPTLTYRLEGGGEVRCDLLDCVAAPPLYPVAENGHLDPHCDDHALAGGAVLELVTGFARIRLSDMATLERAPVQDVADQVRAQGVAGAVVDLRGNPGGDFTKVLPLVDALGDTVARCAVLVNGYTFSAAIVAAVLIAHRLGARAKLFGSLMGDDLRFWAEGGTERLGQCGAALRYSTAWHDWDHGQADRTTPDDIAQHLVAAGPVDIVPVPEADQVAVACSFARGA